MRDRLIELIQNAVNGCARHWAEIIADHLISKGVTIEPVWCEDCKHFCNADMGGEGECDLDNHDTWYGCPICEKFERRLSE